MDMPQYKERLLELETRIEPQRLQAVPWTPSCLKHQTQLEQDTQQKTPTL
jgi:RNA polymerase-binding transcription factor DksA